jgi:hypothetical protein
MEAGKGAKDKEHAMSHTLKTAIAVVGIDIRKNSFHVVGLDQRGAIPQQRVLPTIGRQKDLKARSFGRTDGSALIGRIPMYEFQSPGIDGGFLIAASGRSEDAMDRAVLFHLAARCTCCTAPKSR